MNIDLYIGEILNALKNYKDDVSNAFECQLLHIRQKGKPCRKGLLPRGCRTCVSETLEWLFEEAEGSDVDHKRKNCEVFANQIWDAVINADKKGVRSSCAIYAYRKNGGMEFGGSLADIADKINCDLNCEECEAETARWMVSDVKV